MHVCSSIRMHAKLLVVNCCWNLCVWMHANCKMKCALLLMLAIMPMLVSTSSSSIAGAGPLVPFFIFGDSLVDAGNNDYIFTLSKADWPPYGIDFRPSGGRPTGRFTNGRTIPDIVANRLGAVALPPPFLEPSTTSSLAVTASSCGINFASGGAGILNDTGAVFVGRIPLPLQVANFEKTVADLVRILGPAQAQQVVGRAMFSITVGSNDFLNNYLVPLLSLPLRLQVPPAKFVALMLTQLESHIRRLYELGARKMVLTGVGPLGCIPYATAISLTPRGRCWEATNAMVRSYNGLLSKLVERLNSEVTEATFVYANAYDLLLHLLRQPRQFGFEDTEEPCCGGAMPTEACSSSSIMCKERDKYVFWDAYHPTDAANAVIADFFLNGNLSFVFPMNVSQLFLL